MKKIVTILFLLLTLSVPTSMSFAQAQSTLACGDVIAEQFFSDDLLHEYSIDIDSGTRLIIYADPLPLSEEITLSVEVRNGNGGVIPQIPFAPEDGISVIETDAILSGGEYDIIVTGNMPGQYQLLVSCVTDEDEVITENNLVQSLSCGEQVDNIMVRENELHRYYLSLEEGVVMDIFLEALYGDFAEMTFEMGLYAPDNQELNRLTEDFRGIESQIVEQTVTTDGLYRLYVQGFDATDEDYRLAVDCTLPDGDIAISGGDNRRVLSPTVLDADMETVPDASDDEITMPDEIAEAEDDLPPDAIVPVSDVIEGIPNTGQVTINNPILAYAFMGDEDELVTLAYSRLRGDDGVELWMQAPDGDVVFGTTLDITSELSADLMLPQSGEYQVYFALTGETEVVFTVEVVRG